MRYILAHCLHQSETDALAALVGCLTIVEGSGREGFAGILQSHLHTVGEVGYQYLEASTVNPV